MSELVGAEWTLSPQKRALDLIGMTALMPLFVPASIAISATIRRTDEMEPIFSHTRYGLGLEPFTFYKFRTMPTDAPPDTPSIGSSDDRRTALGKRLSSLHLDEMPQTLNIYSGKMSLVGPRPLIWDDIANTLDILTPTEQSEWLAARGIAKPGAFGTFQLDQHIRLYEHGGKEEFLRARAHADIAYAAHASLATDMRILNGTAQAALKTFIGKDAAPERPRGETCATMLQRVANGFGVEVTEQEHNWWRATLLAARFLDDLVDTQGITNLDGHINDLVSGKPLSGMTSDEVDFFAEVFSQVPDDKQQTLLKIYLALPAYAQEKRSALSFTELLRINDAEAELFAAMIKLDETTPERKQFNSWLGRFSRTGYMADLLLDASKDYSDGNIAILPTLFQKAKLGKRVVRDSMGLLRASPKASYRQLAVSATKTLLW